MNLPGITNKYPQVDINGLQDRYKFLQNTFNGNIKVGQGQPAQGTGAVEPTGEIGGYDYSVPNIRSPKADPNLAYRGFAENLYGDRYTKKAVNFDIMA